MSSLQSRGPYSQEELDKLYPKNLELQLVQILLRHGERSPVTPRFMNAGLCPYWPYCTSARRQANTVMTNPSDSDQASEQHWPSLDWRRRLETFGPSDQPVVASGPGGEIDGICQPGELTDKGRSTTLALGQRLRTLYIHQLRFMPDKLADGDGDSVYLRATPMSRALESVQQAFCGMYPASHREPGLAPLTILTRAPADETLYPNVDFCRRFAQISMAFARRAAERWNESDDMTYLTKKIGKWMPEGSSRVLVDGKPGILGILDTINATLAHGPATRLPAEFYDPKVMEIVDRIGMEEWYRGYWESREFRALGIGALMGDVVERMTESVERTGEDGPLGVGGENGALEKGRGGEQGIKMALSGCHDTTLAGALSSLGAFEGEKWPPYSSHLAVELFRMKSKPLAEPAIAPRKASKTDGEGKDGAGEKRRNVWWSLFGHTKDPVTGGVPEPEGIGRKAVDELLPEEKRKLDGYFVRIRYNDKVMKVPGCKQEGRHLEGDDSFCTLEAFKAIVDRFTPKTWKVECMSNLGAPAFPEKPEPAGY